LHPPSHSPVSRFSAHSYTRPPVRPCMPAYVSAPLCPLEHPYTRPRSCRKCWESFACQRVEKRDCTLRRVGRGVAVCEHDFSQSVHPVPCLPSMDPSSCEPVFVLEFPTLWARQTSAPEGGSVRRTALALGSGTLSLAESGGLTQIKHKDHVHRSASSIFQVRAHCPMTLPVSCPPWPRPFPLPVGMEVRVRGCA